MSDKNTLLIGVVADDFTGASDAASFLVEGGLSTILLNGIPTSTINLDKVSAVVIALKTRTMETSKAVDLSLKAFKWLKQKNAQHIYNKYCSTFDSTKTGNIGPIIDAVVERYQYPYTILAPALPVNGRLVKDGHLYVNGIPLNQSNMKDHPLTPMWDSKIANLMKGQGKYNSLELDKETLYSKNTNIKSIIKEYKKKNKHFYVIPDYADRHDGERITELFKNLPFLTGGSGLLEGLARAYSMDYNIAKDAIKSSVKGKGIILAGSVSQATRSQIKAFIESGKPSLKISPIDLLEDPSLSFVWRFISKNQAEDIMLYSADEPSKIKEYQKIGKNKVAELIEQAFADIAKKCKNLGYTRIIVAGGETSGAVTQALNFNHFIIGESISPGVPIMMPLENSKIRLVLKSGNFGESDFFIRALDMTGGK